MTNIRMSAIDKMRSVRRQTIHGTEDRLEEYASHAKNIGDLQVRGWVVEALYFM